MSSGAWKKCHGSSSLPSWALSSSCCWLSSSSRPAPWPRWGRHASPRGPRTTITSATTPSTPTPTTTWDIWSTTWRVAPPTAKSRLDHWRRSRRQRTVHTGVANTFEIALLGRARSPPHTPVQLSHFPVWEKYVDVSLVHAEVATSVTDW